jgi:hypothetical protein
MIEGFFKVTLPRRRFPVLWVLLGSLAYAACVYALARDLMVQLPARETNGLLLSAFLGKALQLAWVGVILMVFAGADNEPFRTLAHTYRIVFLVFGLALPVSWLLAPKLLIGANLPPLSGDVQDALVRLSASPIYLGFRGLAFVTLITQLLAARVGMHVVGADRRSTRAAVIAVALVYVFINAIGLDRIDIPPPPPRDS